VLPSDTKTAVADADLFAARRRAGRLAATADLMIASIARVTGGRVVKRDIGDFKERGLMLIDP
jgi:predicted nucleic acid-binding protein